MKYTSSLLGIIICIILIIGAWLIPFSPIESKQSDLPIGIASALTEILREYKTASLLQKELQKQNIHAKISIRETSHGYRHTLKIKNERINHGS